MPWPPSPPRSSRRGRGRGSAGLRWRSRSVGSCGVRAPLCDDGPAMGVHLVTGSDESILRAAVTDLVHQLVGDGDRSLMVDEFEGDDYELRSVVDAAQTAPFLTDRRVVVARDVGRFTTDELAPLLGYLVDPLPTSDVVLVGGGGRLAKALTDAVKAAGGTSRSSDPPQRARDRQGWIVEQATAADVRLSAPAAAAIADRLGEDVGRLDGLLATLAG